MRAALETMSRKTAGPTRLVRRIIIVVVLAALARFGVGCNKSDTPTKAADRPNVVVITFDTTRADYLSCYGRPGRTTPTLDRLASEGVRFANAYTVAPITLPAHATILTGLLPIQHGLHDNGAGPLDEKVVTLAEVLKGVGYRTGAVIGAYVLHSKYGLKQGFDFYDEEFPAQSEHPAKDTESAERDAKSVSNAALAWLNGAGNAPYFLWAHYFDPHAPYAAPGTPKEADLFTSYSAEITYADAQLDSLLQRVDELSRSSGRTTLIVFTADHGESLTEHGESSHAFFVYNVTLHVPLIVKFPSSEPRGAVVNTPVSVADICPSILHWLGLPQPYRLPGQVLPTSGGGSQAGLSQRALFFESHFAYNMYGWSPLEGVVIGNQKYISSPIPELYDLSADPHETTNLAGSRRDDMARLAAALALVKNAGKTVPTFASGSVEHDAESIRKLRAFGYVGAATPPPNDPSKLPDPKVMMEVRLKQLFAEKELAEGDPDKGIEILGSVLDRDPNNRQALKILGEQAVFGAAGDAALALLRRRMEKPVPPPFDASLRKAMGDAYLRKKELAQAAEYYSAALAVEEANAEVHANLGVVLRQSGGAEDAEMHLRRALQLSPALTDVRAGLGSLLLERGRPDEAISEYEKVIREKPDNAAAHYDLGVAYAQVKRIDAAIGQFRETIRLNEQNGDAWTNLGIALMRQGSTENGREALLRATSITSSAGAAYYNLGIAAAREGKTAETVILYEKSIAAIPPYLAAIEELTSYYIREKRIADAVRVLRAAAVALPDNLKIINTLASILATSNDDSIRNGEDALSLAKHAAELTQFRQPAVLATLAAACAEMGDFASAGSTAGKAIELLGGADQGELRAAIQVQLDGYGSSQPYRNPRY